MQFKDFEKFSPPVWAYDVRDQLKRHIYDRAEEALARGEAERDAIKTTAQLRRRQAQVRNYFTKCIGGLPSRTTPLNARVTGVNKGRSFTVENIIFESRPKHFVTANLYIPTGLTKPRGAVLYICGHSPEGRPSKGYQAIFQPLVQAGLIVMIQDTFAQGERFAYRDVPKKKSPPVTPTGEHDYAGNQCLPLGDGTARYFIHDALRSIDYLYSRPEVDVKRIGVTGESGGGLHTSMLMMTEPRIAAAAPGLFITKRKDYMFTGGAQDAEQIWRGFTAAGFDYEDMLLTMAPRPVRVLAAAYDFFPIEGARQTVANCKRFWKLYGRASQLELLEDACPHTYTAKIINGMTDFFAQKLLGKFVKPRPLPPLFEPSKLYATRSGQVHGEIPGAHFVHEANCERLSEIEAARKPDTKRRPEAHAWLKRRVFSNRKPCPLNTRRTLTDEINGMAVDWLMWWSQGGILNHAVVFRGKKRVKQKLPATIAVWNGGTTALRTHWSWIQKQCRQGRAVVVLDVTGAGALVPHTLLPVYSDLSAPYGVMHKLADDLSWLGDDLAALRTFDVLRAVDMINEWPDFSNTGTRIYAHGRQGVYGEFAAALDKRIKNIEIEKGIGSFAKLVRTRIYDATEIKSVILHGMLRHFDLPDLKKWNAAKY